MVVAAKRSVVLVAGVAALAVTIVTVLLSTTPYSLRHARASSLVTLRNGKRGWEGEVIWTATGNPLCRQSLSQNDANVICRTLFPDRPIQTGSIHDASELTGQQAAGSLALSNFGCTGLEIDLGQCPRPSAHDIPAVNCPIGAAAIACQPSGPTWKNVRLQDGSAATEGRLELNYNGNWSAVCDLAQDIKLSRLEATPICKGLSYWYTTPAVSVPGQFEAGTGDSMPSVPQCTGDEPDVRYCSFRSLTSADVCNHTLDAGILCTIPAMPSSAVQLTGFINQPWKGAVVIDEPDSTLTTGVCAKHWDQNDTVVTCKSAGFQYGGSSIDPLLANILGARVRLDRLECSGQEATLAQCSGYDLINSFQCPPGQPMATVDCSAAYRARLVNSNNDQSAGAVEIYLPATGQWVSVVAGSMDVLAAQAVCSSIRYQDTKPQLFASSEGSNVSLPSLVCATDHSHVSQCVIPAPAAEAVQSHAAVRCFGCGGLMTMDRNNIMVIASSTVNTDCLYVIRPQGGAPLYKVWLDYFQLNPGDVVDIRGEPEQDPSVLTVGPSQQGPFRLFKTEIYVRVKTSNIIGHRAFLHWAPITVETVTTLICSDDDMKIRVNLTELTWLYPDTDPGYMSLVNEGCTGNARGDTWYIDNPHSQCYTQREIDGSFVRYSNALIYKEVGAGPIVREHRWRVDLQCNFLREMQVRLDYGLTDVYNYQVNLNSDYNAEIHLYNDSALQTELHGAEQIKAHLGDDLYVLIKLNGDWNVSMHLQDCVARPEPNSETSYTLIQNGCATDSQTFIVFSTHNTTLFHFKAFEFYSGFSTVYIYCDVDYCSAGDANPRCRAVCS